MIDGGAPPPLIVRCEDCLRGRWCERCHKWWDEACYTGSAIAQRTLLQQAEYLEEVAAATGTSPEEAKNKLKVYMGFCVDHCLSSDKVLEKSFKDLCANPP